MLDIKKCRILVEKYENKLEIERKKKIEWIKKQRKLEYGIKDGKIEFPFVTFNDHQYSNFMTGILENL